jgi:hypothetical protein
MHFRGSPAMGLTHAPFLRTKPTVEQWPEMADRWLNKKQN